MASSARLPAPHPAWRMVLAGTLCIFAAIGLGRFALGMLLPAMGRGLDLDYAGMGLVSTANFCGYLAAVLCCGPLGERFGGRVLVGAGLVLCGGSMLLVGQAGSLAEAALWYTLTGVGSGLANVPMMGLVAAWFHPRLRGRAGGFVTIGSGFAILLSGWLAPLLNAASPDGWRFTWQVLGGLVLAVALCCALMLRNHPRDLGLEPAGAAREPGRADRERQPAARGRPAPAAAMSGTRLKALCGALYFIFGFTYVIYATFIVTVLVDTHGLGEAAAGVFWSWVGALSLLSGPVFGALSDRLGRRTAFMLVFSAQSVAHALAGLNLPGPALWVSIACFGCTAWSIPTIMTALVADSFGPEHTMRVLGLVTFLLGLGQVSGPALAGWLAERLGGFGPAFFLAAGLTTCGAILALWLPGQPKRRAAG